MSYWLVDIAGRDEAPAPAPLAPRAEVVVVGGGIAGLSAAIALARAGRAVTLLEAHEVGSGASGRNAGMLPPLAAAPWFVPGSLEAAEARWAFDTFQQRVTDELDGLPHEDCGLRPVSMLLTAPSRLARAGLGWLRDELVERGIAAELVGGDVAEAAVGERCRGALVLPASVVHPAKLCRVLRDRAVGHGVAVHERTPVVGFAPTPAGLVVRTAGGGRVEADRVVLAAGGWAPSLVPARGVVEETWAFVTAPLPDEVVARLGGDRWIVGRASPGFSYRRMLGNRLLFGGLDDRVGAPTPPGPPPASVVVRLRRLLAASLPALSDVPIDTAWGGPFHRYPHELPALARSTSVPGLVTIGGIAGSGVQWALVAGGRPWARRRGPRRPGLGSARAGAGGDPGAGLAVAAARVSDPVPVVGRLICATAAGTARTDRRARRWLAAGEPRPPRGPRRWLRP